MSGGAVVLVVIWIASIIGGHYVGKAKGRQHPGEWLTILLGPAGLLIIACVPADREAKIAEAQERYEIAAEAARRAGWPWPPVPPQPPDGPPSWPQGPQGPPPR